MLLCYHLFFFSSRRRHTRWPRDWSSDVCSSDLDNSAGVSLWRVKCFLERKLGALVFFGNKTAVDVAAANSELQNDRRSEERRVGKEWRTGWAGEPKKKRQRKWIG